MKSILSRILREMASWILILLSVMWTYWGVSEMYHEGWWGSWTNRLPYLLPMVLTVLPSLLTLRWPAVGGALVLAVGVFAALMFHNSVGWVGAALALLGAVLLLDAWRRRRAPAALMAERRSFWRRNWRWGVAIGAPLATALAISAAMLPVVLTRQDDGQRGARRIEGNGVDLVWAPAGPGWNWKQEFGGYPSWQSLAWYGREPVGLKDKDVKGTFASADEMRATNLCRYLSADGTTLEGEPVDIWRMPTAGEMVRSLGRHGLNAGCAWDGTVGQQANCETLPDKESPLWATDVPVIYYWTADERDERLGVFVAFNGWVNASYKTGGNPRHGYRCVRDP